jgi:hypothetical protein
MPFVPNGNVAMVELRMVIDGQKVENTLYFSGEPPLTPTTLNDLAVIVESWWADNISPILSTTLSLNEIVVTSLASETAPQIVFTTGLPDTGGNANAALPNNVSWAIKFNTANRGRSGRGRNFIVGLTEEVVSASQLNVITAAQLVDGYLDLLADLSGGDWTWVVYSRFEDKVERTTGLAQEVISVGYTDLIVDSQRRRLPGRGT